MLRSQAISTVPDEDSTSGPTWEKSATRTTNAKGVQCSSSQSPHQAHLIVLLAGCINGRSCKLTASILIKEKDYL